MKQYSLFLCLMLLVSTGWSKPIVRVEGASFRPLKVAFPKVQFEGSPLDKEGEKFALSLSRRVQDYLELIGVFKVLDRRSYLVDEKSISLDADSSQMKKWMDIGAEGLVKGVLKLDKNYIELELGVYQVNLLKNYERIKYRVLKAQERKLALKISNDIYRYFTGEDGPFLSQIVAVKKYGKNKRLVVMDVDGKNERLINTGSDLNILPTLMPDGKSVLFTNFKNNKTNLFSVGLNGAGLGVVSSYPGLNIGASPTPDGKQIALTLSRDKDSEIYMKSLDGKGLKRLTFSYGIDTSPSFSPNGKEIAFVSSRSGTPQIYLMDSDGKNPRRLTFQGNYNQIPQFSPRGEHIVFTARDEKLVFDIFLYNLKSQQISRVTQDQGGNEGATFVPGGRLVVFSSTRNGGRDLYLSNLDGTFQKRITFSGEYWTPSVGPMP